MKSLSLKSLGAFSLLFLGLQVQAAIPKAEIKPSPILRGSGVAMGGKSERNLALMDLRRSYSNKSKMERLVMDFGSANLQPLKGQVGFFHAELQNKPARLILELPQTMGSVLNEKQVQERFKNSTYVKQAMVQFDRNLQSLTMVLELKKPIQVRVRPVTNPKSPGKLVVDMMPL